MQTPYPFFVLAGLAIATAMWQSVRRPPPTLSRPCVKWHATRAALTVSTATLGAVCVLIALGQLL